MPIFETLYQWLFGGLSAIMATVGGVVYRTRKRSLDNQRRLEGDPENPNHEGLMDIASDTRAKVDRMERNMANDHRNVMDRLDEIESEMNEE